MRKCYVISSKGNKEGKTVSGAQSDLTDQRLVFRSRDQCGPIRSLPYLTRPDLVLGEAEAPNECLDLDTLHLLPNLLGHSHTLK